MTVINGRVNQLEDIAAYMEELKKFDFLTEVRHSYMELGGEQGYEFMIIAYMV